MGIIDNKLLIKPKYFSKKSNRALISWEVFPVLYKIVNILVLTIISGGYLNLEDLY